MSLLLKPSHTVLMKTSEKCHGNCCVIKKRKYRKYSCCIENGVIREKYVTIESYLTLKIQQNFLENQSFLTIFLLKI